jgi:chromatin remodeling complex protein RSC6
MATKKGGRKGARKKGGARRSASKKKGGARRTAAKRGGRKRAARSMRKSSARKKRAPNPAFMRPMQPDDALGAVVGTSAMPRTEITKKLWGYIKRNNLQDARERRMINADDKLSRVFGGKKQVSMFEMTKLVNKHMR